MAAPSCYTADMVRALPEDGNRWTPQATFPTYERERLVWHAPGAAEPLVIYMNEVLP